LGLKSGLSLVGGVRQAVLDVLLSELLSLRCKYEAKEIACISLARSGTEDFSTPNSNFEILLIYLYFFYC
jgi:hypothetical protein